MTEKQRQLLFEDLSERPQYPAKYECFCRGCGVVIYPGQPLVFMGDGNRVCTNCIEEIAEEFEG